MSLQVPLRIPYYMKPLFRRNNPCEILSVTQDRDLKISFWIAVNYLSDVMLAWFFPYVI